MSIILYFFWIYFPLVLKLCASSWQDCLSPQEFSSSQYDQSSHFLSSWTSNNCHHESTLCSSCLCSCSSSMENHIPQMKFDYFFFAPQILWRTHPSRRNHDLEHQLLKSSSLDLSPTISSRDRALNKHKYTWLWKVRILLSFKMEFASPILSKHIIILSTWERWFSQH